MKNEMLHKIALALVIIGGLNWGLVGAVSFDLVETLFTTMLGLPILSQIVYVLVGLSALYVAYEELA